MTKIKLMIDHIDDELCGAKEYAEKYVEYKAKGNTAWSNKYKDMANDELRHAMYLHDFAVQEIDEIKKVFTAPKDMQDAWDKSHVEYVEKAAWIKQMLAL